MYFDLIWMKGIRIGRLIFVLNSRYNLYFLLHDFLSLCHLQAATNTRLVVKFIGSNLTCASKSKNYNFYPLLNITCCVGFESRATQIQNSKMVSYLWWWWMYHVIIKFWISKCKSDACKIRVYFRESLNFSLKTFKCSCDLIKIFVCIICTGNG